MVSRALILALIGALAVAAAPAAFAGTVSGKLSGRGVVWISDGSKLAPASAEMRNRGKAFAPDLLAVPVGSVVRFPNDDPFFHSIYSTSQPNDFDIGFYLTGPGKDVTFTNAGVVEVRCHIHVFMRAEIVVVDGPFAEVDEQSFSIDHVLPGDHTIHEWTVDGGLRASTVHVPRDGNVTVGNL